MLVNITKKTVIVFIIGVLTGAIIATAGFLIFSKCKSAGGNMSPPSFSQTDGNVLPGVTDGNGQNGFNNGGQPPQMPGGSNSGSSDNSQNGQPPQMPNGNFGDGAPQLPGGNSSSN